MKVDFYLRFHTRFGQTLSISGNFPQLAPGTAVPMQYLTEDLWHATLELETAALPGLHYHYRFTNEHGETLVEAERKRSIQWNKGTFKSVVLVDTWNDGSNYSNAFYTAPFQEVLLPQGRLPKIKKSSAYTHIFKVKAPLLQQNECVCLLGSIPELKEWNTADPVLLDKTEDWWTIQLNLSAIDTPVVYKYGIYNFKKGSFTAYEGGSNRLLPVLNPQQGLTILHDGFIHVPADTWKGAGVALPVFSLRSNNSFGVGEFTDIKLLVDWAASAGLKLIQLLPVNDTTATFTWQDSYPYAAISAFALHPIYINLSRVADKKSLKSIQSLGKKQKQLNSLAELDYEKVMQFKMAVLKEIYEQADFLSDNKYQQFFEANRHWLVPYAAFSYLRDKFGTADFSTWKTNRVYNRLEVERLASPKSKTFKQIAFYFFVQYHLHLQLKDAADYAHKRGIVLKGDIPIGVYRYGSDAWTAPELYNMDQQAGAPPDDFAVKGQNWGFPTYNWQRMQQDNFEWWRKRFHQMSHYFDAFRIDHILGFFRIWSIPAHAVEGIMGVFIPALPVHITEMGERAIWFDYDRFCKPYITDAVLESLAGDKAAYIKEAFLVPNDRGGYDLKEAFDTQKKVEALFDTMEQTDDNQRTRIALYDLISNVILFEHPGSDKKEFHFRISVQDTTSFQHLPEGIRHGLQQLYIDYFYRRQDEFWKREALGKLPALKESTNMLICGEDLGMVPHSVPEVMKRLGILSLEIQRMPKNPQTQFFIPRDAPYLSVITPSTHDMSTIRGWWEEDRSVTQVFYNTVLGEYGSAPYFCEAWINRAIILQHLYSPAMWSIFQLQDLLGMSELLRRENPQAERINEPANPKHYWRYRMHITLEQLMKETAFNEELKGYIQNSNR